MTIAMPDAADRFWAVLPAGGTGTRIGAPLPKQYLDLGGATMLERSANALLAADWIERVTMVVAPGDSRAEALFAGQARIEVLRQGGATRRDSVLAGLHHLLGPVGARADDWVLVHDAARPGVSAHSLERLRSVLAGSGSGGLLALPVVDTVKRERPGAQAAVARDGKSMFTVDSTISRAGLWLALTPQMFRLGLLTDALERFADVTDEASAIEAMGLPVVLVEGDRLNFKVTTPDDLELMRRLLGDGR